LRISDGVSERVTILVFLALFIGPPTAVVVALASRLRLFDKRAAGVVDDVGKRDRR
jgi:hypothetical protein